MLSHQTYHRQRFAQERAAARHSRDPRARVAHLLLAEAHAERAERASDAPAPDGGLQAMPHLVGHLLRCLPLGRD